MHQIPLQISQHRSSASFFHIFDSLCRSSSIVSLGRLLPEIFSSAAEFSRFRFRFLYLAPYSTRLYRPPESRRPRVARRILGRFELIIGSSFFVDGTDRLQNSSKSLTVHRRREGRGRRSTCAERFVDAAGLLARRRRKEKRGEGSRRPGLRLAQFAS